MKVLFLVPPEEHFIESYVTRKLDKGREFRQRLGLLYVAGYLRDRLSVTPRIVDCIAHGWRIPDVERLIERERPDIVGLSVLTFNLLDCLAAADAVKRVSPATKICFGGFHVTLYPEETLALPNVDYIVVGEGEVTFAELVRRHTSGRPGDAELREIEGLGFVAESGERVINPRRAEVHRLDDLPLPAHDLIDLSKYTFALAEESMVAAIQTSRGCPGRCTFCDMRLTRHRYRSAENVLREVRLLAEMGAKEFFAVDDTFTVNRNRVLSLCRLLIESGLRIRYKISARIDRIDEEMLEQLAKSGCYRIHYGVETGSQRMLDYLEKGITVDQVVRVFEMTRKAGIEVFAYMMLGIPTETAADMDQTFALVKRIKPDHVNYSICTPFPRTRLYEQLRSQCGIADDYWLEFARAPDPSFRIRTMNEHFSEEALRRLQDRALRSFYASPRVMWRELRKTRSLKQLLLKLRTGARLLMPRWSHQAP